MPDFVPLPLRPEFSEASMRRAARNFYQELRTRRTVRHYSERPIPDGLIDDCLRAAGTAPSGANLQPWHFSVVRSCKIKSAIRQAAEAEEREFYEHRAPETWLKALAPLGTDSNKPFLESAPCLIAIFARTWEPGESGERTPSYYAKESVGIATGILITALHQAGLCTLTHTPSPMGFLNKILERPVNEKPFLLLVVGFPADGAEVPDIGRKELAEIRSEH